MHGRRDGIELHSRQPRLMFNQFANRLLVELLYEFILASEGVYEQYLHADFNVAERRAMWTFKLLKRLATQVTPACLPVRSGCVLTTR